MVVTRSLKRKSVTAVLWSSLDLGLRQGLQLAISIVLARLLTPEDFGTVALLYLFTGVASAFIDSGFSAALVQKQDLNHTDESTVFWFNFLMAMLCTSLFWLLAPLIATFYGIPSLVSVTRILALSVLITALGSIQSTLLSKQLDFKTPMKISVISNTVAGLTTIYLALKGYGMVALAIQTLVSSSLTTLLLWYANRWRPRLIFSFDSARRLFKFGSYLMIAGLLDIIYCRIYTVLLGKLYGVRDLGLYSRADSTKQIPTEGLSGMLSKVAFPIFSEASSDKARLRRGVQTAIRAIMLVNIPMMLGLGATAESVLRVIYGEPWLPAAPILEILCLSGLWWPLHVINLNVLKAQGHSNLFFRLELIKKAVGTFLLVIAVPYGAIGIAWSQALFSILAFFINAYYSGVFLKYGPFSQIKDFLPMLIISVFMAIAVHLIQYHELKPNGLLLAVQVCVGVCLYVLSCQLFRIEAFFELRNLIVDRIRKN